jgi:hypothetical protein
MYVQDASLPVGQDRGRVRKAGDEAEAAKVFQRYLI